MSEQYGAHYSVLKREVLDYFNTGTPGCYADLTFGRGGHSSAILDQNDQNVLYGVDQDPDAIKHARQLEEKYHPRLTLIHTNYVNFCGSIGPEILLDGILIDLGVSSHQFDTFERGFSFREDGPLDMRMNYEAEIPTAADLINEMPEVDLANIIFEYGEERYSRRIAKAIVEARKEKKLETTKELENIVFHCYPAKERHAKTHPATRTFQALRIAVNSELDVLATSIVELANRLKEGGKLQIISFHSLEDRIVKHAFKKIAEEGGFEILTKRPIIPSEEEIKENPRSRSAKLRVLQKLTKEGDGSEDQQDYRRKSRKR